jgi:hypothetical protein
VVADALEVVEDLEEEHAGLGIARPRLLVADVVPLAAIVSN